MRSDHDQEDPVPEKRTLVKFGNGNPQMQISVVGKEEDGEYRILQASVPAPHLEQSITSVEMWPGFDSEDFVKRTVSTPNDRVLTMIHRTLSPAHKKYAVGISEMEQIVVAHTGGQAPHWVWSSDPAFAKALGKHFECPVADKSEGDTALVTNAGHDMVSSQILQVGSQPAAAGWMALANSATATTPTATDTTLTGEITTAGGGLLRASATYAHTAGTNTTTMTKTFTANGSDSLPVTISQDALFNASAAGTLFAKTALNANATLTVSGDNVTVTHTLTA